MKKCTCGRPLDMEAAQPAVISHGTIELRVNCPCGRFASAWVAPDQWSTQEEQGVRFPDLRETD